jgi:hypothetical protein
VIGEKEETMANPQNPDPKKQSDEPCDGEPTNPTEPGTPTETPRCPPLDPGPTPPVLNDPKTCDPDCDCPSQPPASGTCLDDLIADQAKVVNEAKAAEDFKKELEELLKKATAAKQAYTHEKYDDFTKRWLKQDAEIVCAIEHVTCKVKCWQCLIKCEICPLLYRIRWIEEKLDGDGTLVSPVHSLRDLRYWHERNRDAKLVRFNRIKAVLDAWGDPAKSIDAALIANDKLIKSVPSLEPSEAVLQVFFKLVPLHLAIAPRGSATAIDEIYYKLCEDCDAGDPDDCCGPDVGVLSARQRMNEPQAYIVDPDNYFDILCCLAKERYLKAKDQLAKAQSDLLGVEAQITSLTADLETRKKSIAEHFKARIKIPIDCDDYPQNGGGCGCDDKAETKPDLTVR